jgi:DegV family protein with EDD domain
MDYVITTCSTTDLPAEYVARHNIPYLPYSYHIEGKEYKDDLCQTVSAQEFFKIVRDGAMPTTSLVNFESYMTLFDSFLSRGMDILHIELSSGVSGSYNSARLAVEELRAKYPERKLYLVDSLSASLGFGLLVHYAIEMKEAGKSIDEIHAWVEDNKLKINHWFTVDDLMHLKRGGRVSGAAAMLGTLLHIKPVLNVDDTGHLIPREKARGRKAALHLLVEKMEALVEKPDGQDIFISHADSLEDAAYVADLVKEKFPGVNNILINTIGPVIGTHSGPGTIALFFLGKHR